ncbi:hypothetical protein HanRHA438_Chr07g0326611 [Helianthus annuus]|nr:hypothetical protein HanRHA438_Chr07g0326611 [Helianthus annuus]
MKSGGVMYFNKYCGKMHCETCNKCQYIYSCQNVRKIKGLLDFITPNYWLLAAATPNNHFDARHP